MSAPSDNSKNPTVTTGAAGQTSASNTAPAEAKPQPYLAEDDEFEDFPNGYWPDEEEENAHFWENSWDDENQKSSFAEELKAEIGKMMKK